MSSLLPHLSKPALKQFLDDLNYLNMSEIKSFCKKHHLPYTIAIQTPAGQLRRTSELDRKGVVLNRVRHFLKTGAILPQTVFPASVISFQAPPKNLTPADRFFYGQYQKNNRPALTLLKALTNGAYQNGAIARILAREFWTAGIAPTYKQFATAWLAARHKHTRPNPEWAFLSDRASKSAPKNWKALRVQKSSAALKILNQLPNRTVDS